MTEKYLVLTNNPRVKELALSEPTLKLIYIEDDVSEVIKKCEELFLSGNHTLAADPLAGRRTRPFPCLTLVLLESDGSAGSYDWNRLADYSQLHSSRIEGTLNCSDRLIRDYQVLDWSFTKAALKI